MKTRRSAVFEARIVYDDGIDSTVTFPPAATFTAGARVTAAFNSKLNLYGKAG
jgi:hypothetical protein